MTGFVLFSLIPCTYKSSPLDGMANNYFIFLLGYARSFNLSCQHPFYFYLLIPEERKNIWSELESNPGALASQATALTTRPWLLGQVDDLVAIAVAIRAPRLLATSRGPTVARQKEVDII